MENTVQRNYGCFLVIPLRYENRTFQEMKEKLAFSQFLIKSMDFTENVKHIMDGSEKSVGICYYISKKELIRKLVSDQAGNDIVTLWVHAMNGCDYGFNIHASYLYVFDTRVAFLCLRLSFDRMDALHAICYPGHADNQATYYWKHSAGTTEAFSLEGGIKKFCEQAGMQQFFGTGAEGTFLLEAYAHIVKMTPQRFSDLDEMKARLYEMHLMTEGDGTEPSGTGETDRQLYQRTEDTVRYVTSEIEAQSYRWQCCITSQTVSYIVADEAMDLEKEMENQAQDCLPITVLTAYERYTCLRFSQLMEDLDAAGADRSMIKRLNEIRETESLKGLNVFRFVRKIFEISKKQSRPQKMKTLKDLMYRFQTYGTISSANLSRWHNVRNIYANMLDVQGVEPALEDINYKMNVLYSYQQEVLNNIATWISFLAVIDLLFTIIGFLREDKAGLPVPAHGVFCLGVHEGGTEK